jgi:hypothetical protein
MNTAISPRRKGAEHDKMALIWLHRAGWLRPRELGLLLWPGDKNAITYGERLVRKMKKNGMVLARELPEQAGQAVVLAAGGVRLLGTHDIAATSGKDIGDMVNNRWVPPATWRHDLMAIGVLCKFRELGYEVFPEREIRMNHGETVEFAGKTLDKIPDGLARHEDGRCVWIEVENAKKSGKKNMVPLATALVAAARRIMSPIMGMQPTGALVAYRPDAVDTRGYALNHRLRVDAALRKIPLKADITVTFLMLVMHGATVMEVTAETVRYPAG